MVRPVIILSKPSLSQNIGACARAMLNFSLTEMRLVTPKANWLNNNAKALAAGADIILENTKVYDNLESSISDLHYIYATTVRPRDIIKDVITPADAAIEINHHIAQKQKTGILFGGEKSGLNNNEIALTRKIITIPLNKDFSSVNLAQSVILLAYEIFQHNKNNCPYNPKKQKNASRNELEGLLKHLESELDQKKYFRVDHKKSIMLRNLKNFFSRSDITNQEIRTLRGVINSLAREH